VEGVIEAPARPRAIVMIDDMPMTPVGKIYKPGLREIAAEEAAREALAAGLLPGAAFEVAARHGESGLVLTAKVPADAVEAARAELGKFPIRFEIVAL
jgi:fatty-acyl-CoA synthase